MWAVPKWVAIKTVLYTAGRRPSSVKIAPPPGPPPSPPQPSPPPSPQPPPSASLD
jgi:hypothetical protein